MITINLYKYEEKIGYVITPNKRAETDTPHSYRLVADEGKVLTDGEEIYMCIDTTEIEKYTEIDDPNPPEEVTE